MSLFHPREDAPKITTPQWIKEEGVEAAIILSIDDYEAYNERRFADFMEPILKRLEKIDGRFPLNIMGQHPPPQEHRDRAWPVTPEQKDWINNKDFWLGSHTHTLSKKKIKHWLDSVLEIDGIDFGVVRLPCCDSRDVLGTRRYHDYIKDPTPKGNVPQGDSSVFNLFTSKNGGLEFEKLVPRLDEYAPRSGLLEEYDREEGDALRHIDNLENYPFPYLITDCCWEFPISAPSDWQFDYYYRRIESSPDSHTKAAEKKFRDVVGRWEFVEPPLSEYWKEALDRTVELNGILTLMLHTGWATPQNVIDLIDYADSTYGKKVKFVNFGECIAKLNKRFLGMRPQPTSRFM